MAVKKLNFDKLVKAPGAARTGAWDATGAFVAKVKKGMEKGVAQVAFAAQREIKLSLNLPGPLPRPKFQKSGGRKLGSKAGKHTVRASKPGEPPRYRTKDLMNSILAEEVGEGVWRVGSPMAYAMALEFGYEPRNLEPRPFIRPVLRRMKKENQKLIFGEVYKLVS